MAQQAVAAGMEAEETKEVEALEAEVEVGVEVGVEVEEVDGGVEEAGVEAPLVEVAEHPQLIILAR